MTDLVTGIGSIITLYGIFEFGNAQQTQDGAAKSFAIQRISGGLIMVIAPQLLHAFCGIRKRRKEEKAYDRHGWKDLLGFNPLIKAGCSVWNWCMKIVALQFLTSPTEIARGEPWADMTANIYPVFLSAGATLVCIWW